MRSVRLAAPLSISRLGSSTELTAARAATENKSYREELTLRLKHQNKCLSIAGRRVVRRLAKEGKLDFVTAYRLYVGAAMVAYPAEAWRIDVPGAEFRLGRPR